MGEFSWGNLLSHGISREKIPRPWLQDQRHIVRVDDRTTSHLSISPSLSPCISLSPPLRLSVFLYLPLSIFLYLSVSHLCLSVSLSPHLRLSVPLYLPLSVSLYLSLSVSLYLYISPSLSPSTSTYINCRNLIIVIVIVNSIFLQRPQERSRGNQLIHRRLSKTKSIGNRSDPESQASIQSDGYGG